MPKYNCKFEFLKYFYGYLWSDFYKYQSIYTVYSTSKDKNDIFLKGYQPEIILLGNLLNDSIAKRLF